MQVSSPGVVPSFKGSYDSRKQVPACELSLIQCSSFTFPLPQTWKEYYLNILFFVMQKMHSCVCPVKSQSWSRKSLWCWWQWGKGHVWIAKTAVKTSYSATCAEPPILELGFLDFIFIREGSNFCINTCMSIDIDTFHIFSVTSLKRAVDGRVKRKRWMLGDFPQNVCVIYVWIT